MPKADINKAGWEQSEFPILCETCTSGAFRFEGVLNTDLEMLFIVIGLGSNPFIRMVCLVLIYNKMRYSLNSSTITSRNKNSDVHAGPVLDLLPSSVGTQVKVHDTRQQSFARPAPK